MDFNISFHDLVIKLFLLLRLTINRVGNPIIPPESPCLTSVLIWNIIYLGFVHSLSKNGKMKKKWKSARWGRDVMFHFFFIRNECRLVFFIVICSKVRSLCIIGVMTGFKFVMSWLRWHGSICIPEFRLLFCVPYLGKCI